METRDLEARIDAIERKLDLILREVELQAAQRRAMEDLKDDLLRVGKDAFQNAVVALDGVHDEFRAADVVHLGRKLMRNVDTITRVVEQLESLKDFLEDASPLARESFLALMDRLDEFDRKGYFAFLKELGMVADNIVTSFSAEDVRHLGENIVAILNTVKSMTQPDVLRALNNGLHVYRALELEVKEDVSFIALLRELNTPEARRGLALAIRFLRTIAVKDGAPQSHS